MTDKETTPAWRVHSTSPGTTKRSRAKVVTDRLLRDIVHGNLQPGQRVTEEELSRRYGVSRVPVREALRVLEGQGFITLTPYTGVCVAVLEPEDVLNVFAVRELIEALTAGQAAVRGTASEIARLRDIQRRGEDALSHGRTEELATLNTALHMSVASIAGSRTLVSLLEALALKVEWVYASGINLRADSSWREHAAIVKAIENGAPDEAAKLMQLHIAGSKDAYLLPHSRAVRPITKIKIDYWTLKSILV